MAASNAYDDLDAMRERIAVEHPDLVDLFDANRRGAVLAVMEKTLDAFFAERQIAPPPAVEVIAEPRADLVQQIAADVLIGPRPLYDADPYGLLYGSDQPSVGLALAALATRYGVTLEALDAALAHMLREDGKPVYKLTGDAGQGAEGNLHEWYRTTVLHVLAGYPMQAPGGWARDLASAAMRALGGIADFADRLRLIREPSPYGRLPDALTRALNKQGPLSASMVARDPTHPAWALEAYIAIDHVGEIVKRAQAEPRYAHQYGFDVKDLDACLTWWRSVEPHLREFPDGARNWWFLDDFDHGRLPVGRISWRSAWVRWFVPRFATAWGREQVYPESAGSAYSADPLLGDYLTWWVDERFLIKPYNDSGLDLLPEHLTQASYTYKRATPPTYGDGPISEERIVSWLCEVTGHRYGNPPWTIQVNKRAGGKGTVTATYQRHQGHTPFFYDGEYEARAVRALLAEFGADRRLWSAYRVFRIKESMASGYYQHIIDRNNRAWDFAVAQRKVAR